MIKWVGTFFVGVAIGAGAMLLVMRDGTEVELEVATGSTGRPPSAGAPGGVPRPRAMSLAEIQELPSQFDRYSAMYELLRSADMRTVEDLLEELDARPGDESSLRSIIHERHVQLAPQAAVERLLAEGNRTVDAMHALAEWASRDFDAALGFVETLERSLQQRAAVYMLTESKGLSDGHKERVAHQFSVEPYLARIRARAEAGTDPTGAWRNALSMAEGELRSFALWGVANAWFKQDPAAVLSAVNSLPDRKQRDSWQQSLLKRWTGVDREAAWDWIFAQPRSERRTTLLGEVAAAVAEDSPAEMLDAAEALDPEERRSVVRRVLQVWAKTDAQAALDALEEMADPQLAGAAMGLIIRSWAESDAQAAFDWVLAQPPSGRRSSLVHATLSQLANADPEQALALTANLDGAYRSTVVETILQEWAREDPERAAAWLDSSSGKTPAAVSSVAWGYAREDPEAAFDWLMDQSAAAQLRSVWPVIQNTAAKSPQTALRLIERIDDLPVRQTAGRALMSKWVETDPRAAVRAIARMDQEFSQELYREVFENWSHYDRSGAMGFVNRIPASQRDAAIQGMLRRALHAGDFGFAERMYDRLASDESRVSVAATMYFSISRTDPERAERYGEVAGLKLDEYGQFQSR